nr:unnamed protein product [Callosobruchus chinensis]
MADNTHTLSRQMVCGLCKQKVMEKPKGQNVFAILPSCKHCFCYTCIVEWKQAATQMLAPTRACPECGFLSRFVCPSKVWVFTDEEKNELLKDYKAQLAMKNCRYFNRGLGRCRFGDKCLFLHAVPGGGSQQNKTINFCDEAVVLTGSDESNNYNGVTKSLFRIIQPFEQCKCAFT